MLIYRATLCLLVLSAMATLGLAEDKKLVVDPSGTWRWDFDANGETIKNVLKLEASADGKVTGSLSARDMKMEVMDGQIKDGKLSFQIKMETPRSFKILFDGKVDGDKVDGKADASSDQGAIELPWTAKRSVEQADVVGAWKLKITLPNDQLLQPTMTIALKEGKLAGTYLAEDGKSIELKKLEVKDNQLQCELDTVYEGADLHVVYKGRPYGSKLKGMLKYTVNSDSGELDYTGVLQPEKK